MPAKRSTVKNTANTAEWTPPGLSGDEIRARFLAFFKERGHLAVPSSSLIPRNDPTVLLTTAGMQQMIPVLSRQGSAAEPAADLRAEVLPHHRHRLGGRRLAPDLLRDARQLLGRRRTSSARPSPYAWELLTEGYGLPPSGSIPPSIPTTPSRRGYWQEIAGIPADSITRLDDNWWGPPGASGPCGPDSEIYFDRGVERSCGKADCAPGCDRCERYPGDLEPRLHAVFTRIPRATRTPLKQPNIDTGMGLERLAIVLAGEGLGLRHRPLPSDHRQVRRAGRAPSTARTPSTTARCA